MTSAVPTRSSIVRNAIAWLFFVYLIVFPTIMPPSVARMPLPDESPPCISRRPNFDVPVSSSSAKSVVTQVARLFKTSMYSSSGWPER